MTEPHFTLPKVPIQFAGEERWLCYPFLSLRRLRDERKLAAAEVLQSVVKSDDLLNAIEGLVALVWCGRIWAEKDLAYSEVEEHIYSMGIPQKPILEGYIIAIAEALSGEKPDDEPKESAERPPVTDGVEV